MVIEITSLVEADPFLDYIVESVNKIKDICPVGAVEPEKVLRTIRKSLGKSFFGLFILAEKEPQGLLSVIETRNLYDELEAHVWQVNCEKGGNIEELVDAGEQWCWARGIKEISACNMVLTKAKRRWLKRRGFEFYAESYRRTL